MLSATLQKIVGVLCQKSGGKVPAPDRDHPDQDATSDRKPGEHTLKTIT